MWSSTYTTGCLSQENKNTNLQRHMRPMSTAALSTIAKIGKQPKYPLMDECRDIMRNIHMQWNTIHPLKKKNEIFPFATRMDLRALCWGKSGSRRKTPRVEFKQPQGQTQAHSQREQTGGCWRPGAEGGSWVSWVKGAKRFKKKKKELKWKNEKNTRNKTKLLLFGDDIIAILKKDELLKNYYWIKKMKYSTNVYPVHTVVNPEAGARDQQMNRETQGEF